MKMVLSSFWLLLIAVTAAENKPLTATAVTIDKGSLVYIPYDARKLTEELAFYPEVQRADFYYLDHPGTFPRAHIQGTATLSTGAIVEWFHYECGGLYLRFKDGSARYFLHPTTVAEMRVSKNKDTKSSKPK